MRFENNDELRKYVEEHKIIEDSVFCDFSIDF